MKYAALLTSLLLLFACTPGQYGPLLINPQDESLFLQGLNEWQTGLDQPAAFQTLRDQYPESPLTQAAETLIQCRQSQDAAQRNTHQLQSQIATLEKNQAQLHQEINDYQSRIRSLNQQINELNTSLEQSKKILLETEGR